MRYIIDGQRPVVAPKRETDSYKIQESGPFVLDDNGQIVFETQLQAFGHWIGSNKQPLKRVGHYGKPEKYYKRRNIPKHLRVKHGSIVAADTGVPSSVSTL
jgi:hypothetical protein